MRTGLVVLVAWTLLSVPVGIMVGRWLARRGELTSQGWVEIFPQRVDVLPKVDVAPEDAPASGALPAPYDWALEELCACPIARVSEDILQDGRLCPDPPDGEDGLCSSCRHGCAPLLRAFRDWRQGVHRD